MITLEMLHSTSLRSHLESVYEQNPDRGVHRPYWSVAGRPLSLVEADELFAADDDDFLLSKTHFTIISNSVPGESEGKASRHACFITDDHCYGYPLLNERGWTTCSFSHRGTRTRNFDSFAEFLAHYHPGVRILQSEQELLGYLNQGD